MCFLLAFVLACVLNFVLCFFSCVCSCLHFRFVCASGDSERSGKRGRDEKDGAGPNTGSVKVYEASNGVWGLLGSGTSIAGGACPSFPHGLLSVDVPLVCIAG